ncbi:SRP19 protein [Loa loa]|uniref:SRP19 protein n=1 Tax=Loa loa TaxID=7209 RepID=A0A1I7VD97_LOALO|nr:SRP19 protein [Loa loa]EFO19597.1 SRP19 protein [Loa loa]
MAVQYKTKPPSEECKWICIYPLYMNSRKTIAQGRRVNKNKAVDSPTAQEIYDILSNAGMKVKLEKQKMHPLDPNRDANAQGRVRVQLWNDDGSLCDEKFPTRMSLMLYACEMVPKLKTRQVGGGTISQASSGSGVGGGKTNKKKKR